MTTSDRPVPRLDRATVHDAATHPAVTMPLGGIGTGNVSIAADGSLREWQLQNMPNQRGEAPGAFFAVRAVQVEPPLNEVRILQSRSAAEAGSDAPLVTDHVVPSWQRDLLRQRPGMASASMRAVYPYARVDFTEPELPVQVSVDAFTPIAPLDAELSGIPAAMFTVTLTNTTAVSAWGWFGASLQNLVGGDGVISPVGVQHPGYGGNVNELIRGSWSGLRAVNPSIPGTDSRAGGMALVADAPGTSVFPQWTEPEQFLRFLESRASWQSSAPATGGREYDFQAARPAGSATPSAPGSTWCGGLAVPWSVEPGQTTTIRLVLAWHFPNRYVNFEQFGPPRPEWGSSQFWLGNEYASRYQGVDDVVRDVTTRWEELAAATAAWCDLFTESTLPSAVAERMATQAIVMRTPTCLRTADGTFFGFEGSLGASTVMWAGDIGGSCALNCTHVWNYEHALAYLYPDLERSMRRTEFEVMQAPEGYIPHRVTVPTYLRQLWDVTIGGPEDPALDGMLGTVLKTYREVRNGGGRELAEQYWENVTRLLDHIAGKWDPENTGALHGIQPSTHDIDLCGVNTFMGTLWLAALRAAEELAQIVGDGERADWARDRFSRSTVVYDEICWDGNYYRQVLEDGDAPEFQWGDGCLSDQLIGQWWAHELGLGYILPVEHVRDALRNVVRHNLRDGFENFTHPYRVYADHDDRGLLMCSWPKGGRPEVPTRYADEVWSGVEYQVAAHCLREGLTDQGNAILSALWDRHDGRRRNPFNEIECGDHYARSLAGWTVLRALTGIDYDAVTGVLTVRPTAAVLDETGRGRLPFVLDTGWGVVEIEDGAAEIRVLGGELEVQSTEVKLP